jgi:hypothetical protein
VPWCPPFAPGPREAVRAPRRYPDWGAGPSPVDGESVRPPVPPTPENRPAPAFTPRSLDPRALETTITPGMRLMAGKDRAEAVDRRQALVERFRFAGPRARRRVAHYVLGAVVFLPALHGLLLSLPFATLPAQFLVAVLYGLFAGAVRLSPLPAGLALLSATLATLALTGKLGFAHCDASFVQLGAYYLIGHAVGLGDDSARSLGD